MNQPTIFEALRTKLGREPTNAECKEDVLRILREEGAREMIYICINGHDRCDQMLPGPDCPYCERRRPPRGNVASAPGSSMAQGANGASRLFITRHSRTVASFPLARQK